MIPKEALLGYCPLHFTGKQAMNGDAAEVIDTYLRYFGGGSDVA